MARHAGFAVMARAARRGGKWFARIDENGNGRIKRAEFAGVGAQRFAPRSADDAGAVPGDAFRGRRPGRREDAPPAD